MKAEFSINNSKYSIDLDTPVDISIPMVFNGVQPNLYNVADASSKAYEIGNFIGDTRLGGSCNFEEYRLVPHCNGTHTECVGHISFDRIPVNGVLTDTFIPAVLISVSPLSHNETNETYDPELNPEDFLITSENLKKAIAARNGIFLNALIIRTLPNDESKKSRRYIDEPPPFFSIEAMRYIASCGINHLIVDLPSVDRMFDEGKMNNHHIYWDLEPGSHETDRNSYSRKTITELVYVPDSVPDGEYILNLQISPLQTDASPSRALLFALKN